MKRWMSIWLNALIEFSSYYYLIIQIFGGVIELHHTVLLSLPQPRAQ